MLKNDVAHGLTVSLPNRDRLTMMGWMAPFHGVDAPKGCLVRHG
jgi:hypothetical protein